MGAIRKQKERLMPPFSVLLEHFVRISEAGELH
jgi:hypothetical protein